MATATLPNYKTQANPLPPSELNDPDEVLPAPYNVESEETRTTDSGEFATEGAGSPLKRVSPYVPRTMRGTTPRRFEPLQQWEGVVEELSEHIVTATIADLTDHSREAEIVTLSQEEFAEADWPVLVPGSIFYWSIGYEYVTGGTKRRVSEIRVRRTPEWSESTVKSIKKAGLDLYRQLGGSDQDDCSEQ